MHAYKKLSFSDSPFSVALAEAKQLISACENHNLVCDGQLGQWLSVMNEEDSIVIVSLDESGSVTPNPGVSAGGGCYKTDGNNRKGKAGLKRSPLFTSTPKSTSVWKKNETIDLVDDDDDEAASVSVGCSSKSQPVIIEKKVKTPPKSNVDPEIILLDDEESMLGSNSRMAKKDNALNSTDTDIEIIGVHVVNPPVKKKKSVTGQSARKTRVSLSKKSRKSSLSFLSARTSVDRAKRRTSIGNSSINKTSVKSHAIRKKNKNQWNIVGGGSNQRPQRPQFNRNQQRMKVRQLPTRRQTSPVFLLDRDIGPGLRNVQYRPRQKSPWESGQSTSSAPSFIPLTRGPRYFSHVPMPLRAPLQQQQHHPNLNLNNQAQHTRVSPFSEPNFIGVADDKSKREPGSLRPIVIDGSNVAMSRRNDGTFSCRGIQICVDHFKNRGHEVIAFVPQYRRKPSESTETSLLDEMERQGVVKFTPSREVGGRRIASYDDRFIVQYAHSKGGIIISNDNLRDLYNENPIWKETIEQRILGFTWISHEEIWFPPDPLGRNAPFLEEFLRF